MMEEIYCTWTEIDGEYFETGCTHTFVFIDDGIEENGFVYCPYCGNAIRAD